MAPVVPEPHLIDKLRLLSSGAPSPPLDVVDLLLHSVPLASLAVRLWRRTRSR